jgi:hypothetical protein
LEPLESASEQITRTSVWQYLRPGQLAYLLALGPPATPDSRVAVTSIAPFLVVAVAALVAVAMSRRPTPVPAVAGAVVVYLLLAAYVLPWYVAWVLPVLALERDGLLGPIVGVQSSLLLVAWQYRGVAPDITDPRVVLWWASALVVSVTAVAATGVLVWKSVGHLVTAQTRSSATPLRR